MAYSGTTSTAPVIPSLVTQAIAYSSSNVTGNPAIRPGAGRTWLYSSTHLGTEVAVVNFFGRDAQRLGFQVGDLLMVYSASQINFSMCLNAGATTSLFSTGLFLVGSSS